MAEIDELEVIHLLLGRLLKELQRMNQQLRKSALHGRAYNIKSKEYLVSVQHLLSAVSVTNADTNR